MERDLSEAHKTIKHAHYGSLQLNWDRHYSISLFYCIEKEKKWKLHYGINLFLSNWVRESLCMCGHFIDLFSPYLAFHLQIPSLEATVCFITLDKKQKIYNITHIHYGIVLIIFLWQLFLLNFLEILAS